MPGFATLNFFGHQAKLPDYYWTGETRMHCMARAIGQSLDYAYAHHIQRLMVTGNFALLAGVHPDAVDAWYLGIYIDAIQWVEMPNTRGMSQFAEGGLVATKPYVSSANYLNKMSDYCRNCHYDHKRVTAKRPAPSTAFTGTFWTATAGCWARTRAWVPCTGSWTGWKRARGRKFWPKGRRA
jgi:deoxyribodipyrimidine photolyase-related protein